MSLYAYCLFEESAGVPVEGLRGVGGEPVRVVRVGGVAALVSDFEGATVAVTRENVKAHNLVNASVLATVTPLPFRFGTLADEGRLAAYAESNAEALAASLARVRGCVEMGVKIIRASTGKARAAWDEGVAEERDGPRAEGVGDGTAFLLAKRRELLGGEALRREAEEAAAWLAALVSGLASESSVRVSPEGSLAVRAAHLVARGRVEEYRERLRAAGEERRDLRLLTSGPWPPYSFSGA